MKIWKGKLRLNGPRNSEGAEVEARIVLGASVLFEVRGFEGAEPGEWRTCSPSEIHAPSWLRALAETGTEVP